MKKFLSVVSIAVALGLGSCAFGMDRSGSLGLGIQDSFSTGPSVTNLGMGAISLKYCMTQGSAIQFLGGGTWENKGIADYYFAGLRVLFHLVDMENSDFYTGTGLGVAIYYVEKNKNALAALRVQLPLGFEWSLPSVPEVGFNVETGLVVEVNPINGPAGTSKIWTVSSLGGQIAGALGMGVHYYF